MEKLKWVFFLGLLTSTLFKLLCYPGGTILIVFTWLIGSIYCINKIIKG